MKIYNSLTRKKEEFKPLVEGEIGMYVCGPTVYDNAHLGHGRSAVAFDVIRRYFLYKGYELNYVSNYTDVDDKMIKRAAEEDISVKELAAKVIPEYEVDYGALGVMKPDMQPLATGYIDEMISIVKVLEEKGFTYVLDDGVYYDVSKFPKYGKLSGNTLNDLQMGARVAVKDGKRNPQDFALWKFKKEGEPFWDSPWGDGRPGWHIECSAMTRKCLGEDGFDIHGGGLDLTFPHHECEIAQTEGAFGKGSFAKYWMHNGFINIDNEKMSKSLNNFFTLKEIFEKYDPRVVRFMFLQTHYRKPVNFSDSLLDQAKAGLERLDRFVSVLKRLVKVVDGIPVAEGDSLLILDSINDSKRGFVTSMDNDFDTSGALGFVFALVNSVNNLLKDDTIGSGDAKAVLDYFREIDHVLAVLHVDMLGDDELSSEALALIEKRKKARADKDFAKSDEIRDQLAEMGISVEDTVDGMIWRKF